MSDFTALPTPYGDFVYRSRGEARWAVFFDKLQIRYQYEPEGFDLGGHWYLPDFYLSHLRMFAEVKPRELDARERCMVKKLAIATRCPVLMLVGMPEFKTYDAIQPIYLEDGPDTEVMDYVLDVDLYKKLHVEGRLCGCNNLDSGKLSALMFSRLYKDAVFEAKTKRFDESGRW